MDWLNRVKALKESEARVKQQATAETVLDLWRWFNLAVDQAYRTAPKVADSWNRHNEHRKTADYLCRAGNISAARVELEKALAALQGATITQPNLI